jgi:hypothetical protein
MLRNRDGTNVQPGCPGKDVATACRDKDSVSSHWTRLSPAIMVPKHRTGILLLACAIGCVLCSASVTAQNITLAKVQDLAFGAIIRGGSAGTVTISTTGTRSSTGGVFLLPSGYAAYMQASFTVWVRRKNRTVQITLPSSVIISSGSNSMTVNTFTSSPSGTFTSPTANYITTINVGARLNVGANQARGTYSGTFNVTVAII